MRILFVMPQHISYGGIETVAINLWKGFIVRGHEVDFVCHGFEIGEREKEISESASKIFHIPVKGKDLFGTIREFEKIIRNGNYDVVHTHMNATCGIYLKIAKKYGVRVLAAHSHASSMKAFTDNPIKGLINAMEKKRTNKYANVRIACSEMAGYWLFGRNEFVTILNAVDTGKYSFSENMRKKKRQELLLSDAQHVLIHVGAFLENKNHKYLLQILLKIKMTDKNVKLILVGDGPLKQEILNDIQMYNLKDDVLMLGNRSDVNELLQAADVYLLPSFSEGNPVSVVEALTSGLHCLVSENVSKDIVSYFEANTIDFLPITGERAVSIWASKAAVKWERVKYSKSNPCKLSAERMCLDIEEKYNEIMGS